MFLYNLIWFLGQLNILYIFCLATVDSDQEAFASIDYQFLASASAPNAGCAVPVKAAKENNDLFVTHHHHTTTINDLSRPVDGISTKKVISTTSFRYRESTQARGGEHDDDEGSTPIPQC